MAFSVWAILTVLCTAVLSEIILDGSACDKAIVCLTDDSFAFCFLANNGTEEIYVGNYSCSSGKKCNQDPTNPCQENLQTTGTTGPPTATANVLVESCSSGGKCKYPTTNCQQYYELVLQTCASGDSFNNIDLKCMPDDTCTEETVYTTEAINSPYTEITSFSPISTTEIPVTPPAECNNAGKYPAENCNQYYECVQFLFWYFLNLKSCSSGQAFNSTVLECVTDNSCDAETGKFLTTTKFTTLITDTPSTSEFTSSPSISTDIPVFSSDTSTRKTDSSEILNKNKDIEPDLQHNCYSWTMSPDGAELPKLQGFTSTPSISTETPEFTSELSTSTTDSSDTSSASGFTSTPSISTETSELTSDVPTSTTDSSVTPSTTGFASTPSISTETPEFTSDVSTNTTDSSVTPSATGFTSTPSISTETPEFTSELSTSTTDSSVLDTSSASGFTSTPSISTETPELTSDVSTSTTDSSVTPSATGFTPTPSINTETPEFTSDVPTSTTDSSVTPSASEFTSTPSISTDTPIFTSDASTSITDSSITPPASEFTSTPGNETQPDECVETSTESFTTNSPVTPPSECNSAGLYPAENCHQYYECVPFLWWYNLNLQSCSSGEAFNTTALACGADSTCDAATGKYLTTQKPPTPCITSKST